MYVEQSATLRCCHKQRVYEGSPWSWSCDLGCQIGDLLNSRAEEPRHISLFARLLAQSYHAESEQRDRDLTRGVDQTSLVFVQILILNGSYACIWKALSRRSDASKHCGSLATLPIMACEWSERANFDCL